MTRRINTNSRIPDNVKDTVTACAQGRYQQGLLDGREPWSGATLTGKARAWASRYAVSRDSLVERIDAQLRLIGWRAETEIVTCKDRRPRRLLILTSKSGARYAWDHIFGQDGARGLGKALGRALK